MAQQDLDGDGIDDETGYPMLELTGDGNGNYYANTKVVMVNPNAWSTWANSWKNTPGAGISSLANTFTPDTQAMTTSQAKAYYNIMKPDERKNLNAYHKVLPAFGKKPYDLWTKAVASASGTPSTPWEILELMVQNGASSVPGPKTPGSGPQAFTNKTVNLSTPDEARTIVDQALSGYLGREASETEAKQFYKILTAEQKANPQIDQGVSSKGGTTRTTSGGVSATAMQEMGKEFAQSRTDFSEYQASTTYLNAFMDLLDNKERMV